MMMLGHRRYARQLDAYVDGELARAHAAGIEHHLHDCPDCSAHVKFLYAMKRSLHRMTGSYTSAW